VRESCIEPFKVCEVFNGCLFLSPRREGAKTPRFVEKVFFVMLTWGGSLVDAIRDSIVG